MDMENKDQASTDPESAAVFDENGEDAMEACEKSGKHDKKHKMRKLCKLVKKDFLKGNLEEYKALVVDSKWVCKECGRASNDSARLHAPVALEQAEEEAPNASGVASTG